VASNLTVASSADILPGRRCVHRVADAGGELTLMSFPIARPRPGDNFGAATLTPLEPPDAYADVPRRILGKDGRIRQWGRRSLVMRALHGSPPWLPC
jgi:hypothetical protein